jgi:hypothetical protein
MERMAETLGSMSALLPKADIEPPSNHFADSTPLLAPSLARVGDQGRGMRAMGGSAKSPARCCSLFVHDTVARV